MHFVRNAIAQFPFHGVFFDAVEEMPSDGDLLGDGNSGDGDLLGDDEDLSVNIEIDTESSTIETILLETECDIQQSAKLINSGTIMADFKVFCPCEPGAKLPIRFNSKFRCSDYAIPINGRVVGLEYSQLGGFSVDIKMSEV